EPEPEALQDRRRDAFTVADQAEEDVLSPHEIVTETASFLPRQDDDPPRAFRESFKHWRSPPLPQVAGCEFFLRPALVTGLRPQYTPPPEALPAFFPRSDYLFETVIRSRPTRRRSRVPGPRPAGIPARLFGRGRDCGWPRGRPALARPGGGERDRR